MRPGREQQRGVAMIMAVLIVALAVILATQIGWDSTLEQRRSETTLILDQGFQVGIGAEAWAATYLQEDAKDDRSRTPKADHLTEKWATPIPPIPIDGGEIEGQLEDLQGRFNLNNLVDQNGVRDEVVIEEFRQLLELLQLEQKWTDLIVDWIDKDHEGAGEDDLYSTLNPPYRPANRPVTSTSELLALPNFGFERYQKLAPYVAALPRGLPINICTASGIVIDAILWPYTREREFSQTDPRQFAQSRASKCYPEEQTLLGRVGDANKKIELDKQIGQTTEYFRLTTLVTIGTTEFTLYSLLHREESGQVRPILRSFGTE